MPAFAAYGLRIDSEMDFPGLPPATGGAPASLRVSREALQDPDRWLHDTPRPDGERWLSIGKLGPRIVLRFHGAADFLVEPGGLDVEARLVPGASLEAARFIYLDHVLPRALAASGRTVLHASAVGTDRGAIAFAGESGSGKSTLAAAFCEAGARLLSDDAVLLDADFRVVPSYPVHRLWPASGGDKERRAPVAAWDPAPAALRAIFLLVDPAEPWLARVAGAETLLALVRHSFRLDPTDAGRAASEFGDLGSVAERIPVVRLGPPRVLGRLPEVKIKIAEYLENSLSKEG